MVIDEPLSALLMTIEWSVFRSWRARLRCGVILFVGGIFRASNLSLAACRS